MKKLFLFFVLITLFCQVKSQSDAERFKTQVQRVNTQGTTPPQTRFNFYTDKLNSFLISNEWKGDQVLSIKEMKVMPLNDPSDWYYFVAVKTKKCSTSFILTYDIGDSNLGEMFVIEPAGYPIEFKNFVEKRVKDQIKSANDLEVAKELYGAEALKVFNEQVIPSLTNYIKTIYVPKIKNHVTKSVDNLLEGYAPEDSTKLSKEKFKDRILKNLFNSGNYEFYIKSWSEDPEGMIRLSKDDFINAYVLDKTNAINNYLAKKKEHLDENIKDYYYNLEEKENSEISGYKNQMWYRKLHFNK